MTPSFADPFETLFSLQRALESRLASDWIGRGTAAMGSYPSINVFQQKDDFVAVIELPGIDKDGLQLEAKENTIRVSGKKTVSYREAASVHRRERVWGEFDRTLSLPVRIDPNGIRAEYRDGLLTIFIPRAESDRPRTIKIG